MNDILEFLEIKKKPIICFSLLNETIQLLKEFNIDGNIFSNILKFKVKHYNFKIRYSPKDDYYYVNIDDSKYISAYNPKNLIMHLKSCIKMYL